MAENLSGLYISESFPRIVQISGSQIADGTGSLIPSLEVTASHATFAESSTSASYASTSTSASYAVSSSLATSATSASFATSATSASVADFATTASYALNAESADTGSLMVTGSAVGQTLTFTKGDGSTFNLDVAATGSSAGSLTTASISDATITFTKGDASTFNIVVNNVNNAANATLASSATSASHALVADTANTATFATSAGTASVATTAILATSASYAVNAGSADSATTASHALIADDLTTGANINISSISASDAFFVSASITNLTTITGSIVQIGDAFVVVNTATPASRYAGIKVVDSGSSPTNYTASLFFDSVTNDWNYEYSGSDPTNFGVALFGPEYTTKGSPTYPTSQSLVKSNGGHHLESSIIVDNGSTATVSGDLTANVITALTNFAGDLTGTASFATTASYALNAEGGGFPYTGSAEVLGNVIVNLSGATDAYYIIDGVSSGSVIDNLGDTYTSSNAVKHIVTLTQTEYNAISASADGETLYNISDAASFAATASYVLPLNQTVEISGSLSISGSGVVLSAGCGSGAGASVTLAADNPNISSGEQSAIIGGSNHSSAADKSAIVGGLNNTLSSGKFGGAIAGGQNLTLNTQQGFAGGGYQNTVNGDQWNAIVGGSSNTINGSQDNVIIGGTNNSISSGISQSVILGGNSIVASQQSTAYAENFISSGSFQHTGSFEVITKVGGGAETFSVQEIGGAGIKLLSNRNYSVLGLGTADQPSSILINYGTTIGFYGAGNASGTPHRFSPTAATFGVPVNISGSAAALNLNGTYISSTPVTLSIASLTASMDCTKGNFFTLGLIDGADTHVDASNIQAGSTYNLKVTQGGAGTGTISFADDFAFPTGSVYTGSAVANAVDIVSSVTFDGTTLYTNKVENLI